MFPIGTLAPTHAPPLLLLDLAKAPALGRLGYGVDGRVLQRALLVEIPQEMVAPHLLRAIPPVSVGSVVGEGDGA